MPAHIELCLRKRKDTPREAPRKKVSRLQSDFVHTTAVVTRQPSVRDTCQPSVRNFIQDWDRENRPPVFNHPQTLPSALDHAAVQAPAPAPPPAPVPTQTPALMTPSEPFFANFALAPSQHPPEDGAQHSSSDLCSHRPLVDVNSSEEMDIVAQILHLASAVERNHRRKFMHSFHKPIINNLNEKENGKIWAANWLTQKWRNTPTNTEQVMASLLLDVQVATKGGITVRDGGDGMNIGTDFDLYSKNEDMSDRERMQMCQSQAPTSKTDANRAVHNAPLSLSIPAPKLVVVAAEDGINVYSDRDAPTDASPKGVLLYGTHLRVVRRERHAKSNLERLYVRLRHKPESEPVGWIEGARGTDLWLLSLREASLKGIGEANSPTEMVPIPTQGRQTTIAECPVCAHQFISSMLPDARTKHVNQCIQQLSGWT